MSEDKKISKTTIWLTILGFLVPGIFLIAATFIKKPKKDIFVTGNITQNKVHKNEEFTLNWKTTNIDKCLISFGDTIMEKTQSGSMLMSTEKNITIIITGKKGNEAKSHQIDVKVIDFSEKNPNNKKDNHLQSPKRVDVKDLIRKKNN